MSQCKCSMSISALGDGCRYCQPQEFIDRLAAIYDLECNKARRKRRKQRLKTCVALGERNKAREELDTAREQRDAELKTSMVLEAERDAALKGTEAMSLLLQLAEHHLAAENFTSTGEVVATSQADRDRVRDKIQSYFATGRFAE
jgi:tellurite resistance protein